MASKRMHIHPSPAIRKPQCLWKQLTFLAAVAAFACGAFGQTPPTAANLPGVAILASDATALAGTSSGAFTLVRSGPADADLTVNLDIAGSAVNGVDYTTIANTLTIPAGFLAVDIPVQPIPSATPTTNKSVVITVQTNAAYHVGDARRAG